MTNLANLFIAIDCEELPAGAVNKARESLVGGISEMLKGIPHGEIKSWSTPRRLAVQVKDVAPESPRAEQIVTGPPANRAFADGQPTKAAEGFARGRGVPVEELFITEGPRGEVVAAKISTGGESTTQRISQRLEEQVLGIDFEKRMRWGAGHTEWSRPLHRVIALYDGKLIDANIAGIRTSQHTVGHRLFAQPLTVTGASDWLSKLESHKVIADHRIRFQRCREQLEKLAGANEAVIRDWDLLEEVVNLVEFPVTIRCSFPQELLELPPRLLVEAMKLHQRVFPLFKDGALINDFLTVTNQPYATDPDVAANIAEGNKRVLTARFYDARFFYAEDRQKPLSEHGTKLQTMRWVRNGGMMSDKVQRIAELASDWAAHFDADPELCTRAALLCKNDLATQMVNEFPKLQGHVGSLLAICDGEHAEVASAIEEHYLPRYAEDALPTTATGNVLAMADRWDTLSNCFRLKLNPKGSGDPLGLRRAANGLLQIAISSGRPLDLKELCSSNDLLDTPLQDFLLARLRTQLNDQHSTEAINAVLETGETELQGIVGRLKALQELIDEDGFAELRATFRRVIGLSKDHDNSDFDATVLVHPSETPLIAAAFQCRESVANAVSERNYQQALSALTALKPLVDQFFDGVMVMDDNIEIREARLGLLRSIADQFKQIADLTQFSTD